MMKTYPMLSFRCDDKLLKQVRKEAKRRGMNTSEFIKEAVSFHLENLAEVRAMQRMLYPNEVCEATE